MDTLDNQNIFITDKEFNLIRDFISKKFGIVVKDNKKLTLHTKLSHRLSILGIHSYKSYYEHMLADEAEQLQLVSHVTNQETYFMREKTQLAVFSALLADIKRSKQKRDLNTLNILSAGCSTGEEPYTLNILLLESGLFSWGWQTSIFGMDVSKSALKKARQAEYSKNSFRMLNGDSGFIKKYFDSSGEKFVLRRPYRHNVTFIHGNIVEPSSFDGMPVLDIIMARNILIYMSDDAIERIAENFHRALSDEGFLLLGSSESLLGRTELFYPEHRDGAIIYRKRP